MQKSLTIGRLTAAALFAVAALIIGISTAFAAPPNWDTTGSYEVAFTCTVGCSGTYNHDLTLSQNGSGVLTGSGGNPVGAHVYNWALTSGTVDADAINFTANYSSSADAVTPQTTMNVVGTIVAGGTMSGTWTDNYQGGSRSGTWTTVSGTADPIVVTPPPTPTTVVISGNTAAAENQPGWMFNRDPGTDTPFEFNTAQASIGTGALYVLPIGAAAADKFIAENFINTPITNVNTISYDFRIGSGGDANDDQQFYMNVYANFGQSDDLKFYDCRYNVIPTIGSTGNWTTVTFDPTQAYPVDTRGGANASPFTCPAIPADMNTLSPGSNIRMFSLSVGDTSTSDVGLDGYLDKVVVNTDSSITTYDFEPAPAAAPVHVTIIKYIDEAHATAANANSSTFTMQATYDFTNADFPSGIAGTDPYDIGPTGNNTTAAYEAQTREFYPGADYSTYEHTGNAVVGATCADGKPFALNGYSSGDTLLAAQGAATTTVAPAFTNMSSNKFVIVHNKTCAVVPPAPTVPPANACTTPGTAPAGYTLQNGSNGNDTVTLAPNTMYVGKGGNDKVSAGPGNYIVCTAGGNDTITLGNGNSTIDAGNGNNNVTVGNGEGTIMTGSGNDVIVAGNGARTITAGNGNNKVTTGDQVQNITAGSGNDEIMSGGGDDTVNAGGGNNKLWGEGGADMLTSAAGNDQLDGGAGTDTCQAGAGNNTKTSCEL